MANAQAMDLGENSTPADQGNPWDASSATAKVLDPTDPASQAAIRGYRMGVSTGKIDPQDGVERLKKAGIVHPTTQPTDLLPTPTRAPASAAGPVQGPPSPPTPYAGTSMGPWAPQASAKLTDVNDPKYQAAIRGYQQAVSLPPNHPQYVDPHDGLNRLKKLGAVTPDTQVSDIAPPGVQTQLPSKMKGATPTNASNITQPQNQAPLQGQMLNPWQNAFQAGKSGDLSNLMGMGMMPMTKTGNSQTETDTNANTAKTDQSETDLNSQKTDQSDIEQNSNKTENKNSHTANIKKFDPEDYSLRLAQAQGHVISPRLGPDGTPMVDSNGRNVYDVGGLEPNSPFQQQKAGLDRIQNLLNMQARIRANAPISSTMDLSPLMRLGEIMTGSKGDVESYQKSSIAPESARDIMQRMMQNEQGVQSDRAKLQQSLFENMKSTQPTLTYADMVGMNTANAVNNTQKNGVQNVNSQTQKAGETNTNANTQVQKAGETNETTTGNPATLMAAARLGQGQQRIDQRAAMGAQGIANNDSLVKSYQTRIDGANKAYDLIKGMNNGSIQSTKPILNMLTSEIARLDLGSQAPGLEATQSLAMNDLKADLQNIANTFTGNETGSDLKQKVNQAQAMLKNLSGSYKEQQASRLKYLSSSALPNQQATFAGKQDALKQQNAVTIPQPKKFAPPTGSNNPNFPGAGSTIKVIDPTGKTGTIPAEDWPAAKKLNYKKVGG